MHNKERNIKANLAASYNELVQSFTALSCGTVGNYTLGRVVGKGSYGKAYQATHKFLGGKVVLKSTPKSEAANLAREIHHHRRLHHPHITQLYEVIITEEKVWLVLESCANGELYDHVVSNQQLVESEAQRMFAQICGAVAYIHNQGVVHRDLKLENIFLDKRSNAKLGDFGFTRENDKSWLKTWCGTLSYCAPEIVRGDRYHGEAIDIWSLGVILFALLSGHLPFDEEDEDATRRLILDSTQIYPPFFSPEVKNLLDLMLHKDPIQRPSAVDILKHPFLSGHGFAQLAHLEEVYVPTFTSKLERTILERMSVAGIDKDKIVNSVLDYRCDSLCGWWWLSLQKERRREKRQRAISKRRSVDFANDAILGIGRQSRSRRGSAEFRSLPNSAYDDYKFSYGRPSHDSDGFNISAGNSTEHVSTENVPEALPRVPSKTDIHNFLAAEIKERRRKSASQPSDMKQDTDLTPTATCIYQTFAAEESNEQHGEQSQRKQGIMQSFRTWWAEQTKSVKTDNAKTGKLYPGLTRKAAQPPISTKDDFPKLLTTEIGSNKQEVAAKQSYPRPHVPSRPIYRRRKSSQLSIGSVRAPPRRKSHIDLLVTMHDSDSTIYGRSSSPAKSTSSVDRLQPRPSMHRTASASSAQSSIGSFRLTGQAGHSKASSTSSNSTFASTRSIRSPRNPLKVMPSTPPPFMIAHQGGYKERNVFDSSLSVVNGPVACASRKRAKRGVLLQTKKIRGHKRLEMKEIPIEEEEEEEEEEEDEEVEEHEDAEEVEEVESEACVEIDESEPLANEIALNKISRRLLDLAEEQEESNVEFDDEETENELSVHTESVSFVEK